MLRWALYLPAASSILLHGGGSCPAHAFLTIPLVHYGGSARLRNSHLQTQVVDAHTLEPVADVTKQSTVVAIAAFFGSVRLIDNLEL